MGFRQALRLVEHDQQLIARLVGRQHRRGDLAGVFALGLLFADGQAADGVALEPDPKQRLDLRALMEGKASDPTAWPDPFRDDPTHRVEWTEVTPGHHVRMAKGGL